ncbi:MAG TPA: phosphatase PAP2 family protein [Gaiellaceae bacterium]|nr:phosphatase PAP2 family protein [Gaiellaceae bacterium]
MAVLQRNGSLRHAAAAPHRGLVEVATLASLYGVYEVVRGRGHATLAAARAHTDAIVSLERDVHVFGERAVQHAMHALPAVPALLGLAYILMHFVGTTSFVVWTYRRQREHFPFVRNTLIVATAIALVVYVVFPAAPPRLAGLGFSDTVSTGAHVNLSSNLLGSLYNPFAAVPSLHFGYALLVGAGIVVLARSRAARIAGALYPFAMLFVIVATGNHFFFDAFAGGVVVIAAASVARALGGAAREPARRRHPESAVAPC